MRTTMLCLLIIAALSLIPSCSGAGKLKPCQAPNVRLWCRCEVAQSTEARAAAGLPVACTIPFVATKCVDKDAMGGMMEFMSGLDKLTASYTGPGGWPPYITVGDNAYWLRCPAKTPDGYSDCVSGQPGNPWPTLPVADLESANPITPGIRPQCVGCGGSVAGTGTEGGDCAICLADAPCDGLTRDQCITMHCAAVCPWDSMAAMTCQPPPGGGITSPDCVGAGASCGVGASCCAGMVCYASDVGATCM